MHYLIVRAGRVGRELTKELLKRDNTVCLIDKDPTSFARISEHPNLSTVTGVGFDRQVLEAAHIEDTHGLAAVTNGDNSNIVIARIAKEIFHVDHVAARIYDPRRASLYHRLGISTVATVSWASKEFIKKLTPDNDNQDWVDGTGEIVIIEKLLPNIWAGKSLNPLFESEDYVPIAWSHLGETKIIKPGTKGQEDARIYFSCIKSKIDELNEKLANPEYTAGEIK